MYHKATIKTKAYYDSLEELPKTAIVHCDEWDKDKELTISDMYNLSNQGWYTVVNECNFGICDHWISITLSEWIKTRFNNIIRYTDKSGNIIGYNRYSTYVRLTKNANIFHAEVWNT